MPVPSELLTSLKDGTYTSTELKLEDQEKALVAKIFEEDEVPIIILNSAVET